MVIGTWVAGLATFLAVITSLYLSRRAERVRLKIWVGIRVVVPGTGAPRDEYVCFNVTNIGERPVVINLITWVIGRGKKRTHGNSESIRSFDETISRNNCARAGCHVYGFALGDTELGE